jgi:hypothetical protein
MKSFCFPRQRPCPIHNPDRTAGSAATIYTGWFKFPNLDAIRKSPTPPPPKVEGQVLKSILLIMLRHSRRHLKPLMPTRKPIHQRKQHDSPQYRRRIVHRRARDRQNRGKGEENDDEDAKRQAGDVHGDAPAAEVEGAVGRVAALEFSEESEGEWDHVGEVQAHCGEGEDGAEGGGVADVD